jgi:hypothetical protein
MLSENWDEFFSSNFRVNLSPSSLVGEEGAFYLGKTVFDVKTFWSYYLVAGTWLCQ